VVVVEVEVGVLIFSVTEVDEFFSVVGSLLAEVKTIFLLLEKICEY
jgi:hypothetical protein